MRREIELHDSRVAAIITVGDQVVLVFGHAYIHDFGDRTSNGGHTGWSQAVALTFAEAAIEGEVPELPADIWHGEFELDGKPDSLIAIPCEHTGDTVLSLQLDSPAEIIIRGRAVTLTLLGRPIYVEEVPAA